jgi:hypothetical protein
VQPEAAGHISLQGDGSYDFEIVGESRSDKAIESIVGGRRKKGVAIECTALLVPELGNPNDRNAVRVEIAGQTVGYFSRDDTADYRRQLARLGFADGTASCRALVISRWDTGRPERGHYRVRLDLIWPVLPSSVPRP